MTNQYALVAFLYHDDDNCVKMLTEHDLRSNALQSGTPGRAIIERRDGERAVLYGVQFQRMEMRSTPRNNGCVYVCVLKAINPFDSKVNHDGMLDVQNALQQWKEVYILWKRVPAYLMTCFSCNALLREQRMVLFEDLMPVCTAYCTVFSPLSADASLLSF